MKSVVTSYDGVKNTIMAPTKKELEEKYVKEGLTQREIADKYGVHQTTVSNWLQNHGISTGGRYSGLQTDRVEYAGFNPADASGYERWRAWDSDKGTNENVYVHRLLAVAEFGFDSVAGMHVHHRNGIPWDNRAQNIQLVTNREHRLIHGNGGE